ncbi:MAG TPA: hypothetical protein PLW10_07295 [Myxococcota bacterium]|nr:hypothetical protein [Myxococcota bacterium]
MHASAARPVDVDDRSPRAAITTPFWDAFLSGGLALVGMSLVLLWVATGHAAAIDPERFFALTILINTPHFLVSYRVLYASRARIRAHPWASLVVPAGLVATLVFVATTERPGPIVSSLVLAGSIYLAWHYAGQTWGMVATFARLEGVRFTDLERAGLRAGPRALIALHVLFALTGRFPPRSWIDPATWVAGFTFGFQLVLVVAVVTCGLGIACLVTARRRHGRMPARVVLPWASLFVWYPFWYFVPGGFFFVQLSHALQYLAFPLRVEVNRFASTQTRTPGQRRVHAIASYVVLVGVGAVVLHGPPLAAHAFGEGWYSTPWARTLLLALTSCVGLHHYFVDGAIWKLRDADVREMLFSHLDEQAVGGGPDQPLPRSLPRGLVNT